MVGGNLVAAVPDGGLAGDKGLWLETRADQLAGLAGDAQALAVADNAGAGEGRGEGFGTQQAFEVVASRRTAGAGGAEQCLTK